MVSHSELVELRTTVRKGNKLYRDTLLVDYMEVKQGEEAFTHILRQAQDDTLFDKKID